MKARKAPCARSSRLPAIAIQTKTNIQRDKATHVLAQQVQRTVALGNEWGGGLRGGARLTTNTCQQQANHTRDAAGPECGVPAWKVQVQARGLTAAKCERDGYVDRPVKDLVHVRSAQHELGGAVTCCAAM